MDSADERLLLPGYKWIVYDPDLLGGKPTIRGTRLSVALILEGLAQGMTPEQIAEDYPGFPVESIPDVLKFAAKQANTPLKRRVASGS